MKIKRHFKCKFNIYQFRHTWIGKTCCWHFQDLKSKCTGVNWILPSDLAYRGDFKEKEPFHYSKSAKNTNNNATPPIKVMIRTHN